MSNQSLINYRSLEVSHYEALESAKNLKYTLNEFELNVVTAESLTAGMIVKTLVDIPGHGATVYGGFAVYDTDAKRKYLDVKTKGVYSHNTAEQMAYGALMNSRAMISIAVTGNAMPFPDHKEDLGQVFIGIGLRTNVKPTVTDGGKIHKKDNCIIITYEKKFCDSIPLLCKAWKDLNDSTPGHQKYAPYQLTSLIADIIRLKTVSESCNLAVNILRSMKGEDFKKIEVKAERWDSVVKPSWIISSHLNKKVKLFNQNFNGHNQTNYNQSKINPLSRVESRVSSGYLPRIFTRSGFRARSAPVSRKIYKSSSRHR
jgi:PncC family amidohydrolase